MAKDSHNSSKPPSSDPPFKKLAPRALRRPSGKKPGGQKDHPCATRTLVDAPEHTVVIAPAGRFQCGCDLSGIPVEELHERRQVADLVVRREVTEYRSVPGAAPAARSNTAYGPPASRRRRSTGLERQPLLCT